MSDRDDESCSAAAYGSSRAPTNRCEARSDEMKTEIAKSITYMLRRTRFVYFVVRVTFAALELLE